MRLGFIATSLTLACWSAPGAVFFPVTLTPGSYNQDMVVENTAPPPIGRATTASMDGGTNNTGNIWYEVGFNSAAPGTGLPAPGATFTHASLPDHQYTMPPSYTAPNALLIASAQVTTGALTLVSP